VIWKPGALSVYSSGAASPNCEYLGSSYGVLAAITYTIKSSEGATVQEQNGGIPLLPYFTYVNYNFSGERVHSGSGNVGGHGQPWPSNLYANTSNGRFLFIPLGYCDINSYPPFVGESENLYIVIGNQSYAVRSQSWTSSSDASGSGTLTNGTDVTVSR
jgi:hypothetical protein